MNLRQKYTQDYVIFCLRFKHLLSEWEAGFMETMEHADPNKLTSRQFNKLKSIAERITKEVA